MKMRCLNQNTPYWKNYGGRGITICDRWMKSFPAFVQDVGERPHGFTIERIDNSGPYEHSNCRWVSRKDQMLNRRNTLQITIEGITYKAAVLAKLSGFKTDTIIARSKNCATLRELLDPTHRIFWAGLAMAPSRTPKTHCPKGHEYSPENTYIYLGKYKQCIPCNRARTKASRIARKHYT